MRHLAELFSGGNSLGTLTVGIEKAIHESFNAFGMRNMTQQEVRRRFDICVNWAEILRADLSWGVQRIVQALPDILATELNGKAWQPNDRRVWVPKDGH